MNLDPSSPVDLLLKAQRRAQSTALRYRESARLARESASVDDAMADEQDKRAEDIHRAVAKLLGKQPVSV